MSRRKAISSLRILADGVCAVRACVSQQPASLSAFLQTSSHNSLVAEACQAGRATSAWHRSSLACCERRAESSQAGAQGLSDEQYHRLSDTTLDLLWDRCEAYVEDAGLEDGDVQFSQGVLTVKLGQKGTYVINKQTPNRQIWMSSPVSGPVRYDWHCGRWIYRRDGHDMLERLQNEFRQMFDTPLDLSDEH